MNKLIKVFWLSRNCWNWLGENLKDVQPFGTEAFLLFNDSGFSQKLYVLCIFFEKWVSKCKFLKTLFLLFLCKHPIWESLKMVTSCLLEACLGYVVIRALAKSCSRNQIFIDSKMNKIQSLFFLFSLLFLSIIFNSWWHFRLVFNCALKCSWGIVFVSLSHASWILCHKIFVNTIHYEHFCIVY